MKSISRSVCAKFTCFVRSVSIFPQRQPYVLPRYTIVFGVKGSSHCSSIAGGERGIDAKPSLEVQAWKNQLEEFRHQVTESKRVRVRVQRICTDIEIDTSFWRCAIYGFLLELTPDGLEKAKVHIGVLREHFSKLAEIIQKCHGQYYRYHCEWTRETQNVVSLLGFMHWLETGSLLLHAEAEEKLALKSPEFGLDIEDYLIGLCNMSSHLPYYVRRQLKVGNYDSSRKAYELMEELGAIIFMPDLQNEDLFEKFDGAMDDLRTIERRSEQMSMWKVADLSPLPIKQDGAAGLLP